MDVNIVLFEMFTFHISLHIVLFEMFTFHISLHIVLFVSSKPRRLKAQNFAVILIFIPFTTYEKTSFNK